MILDRIFKTIFSSRSSTEKALSSLDEARHLINLRRTDEAARIIESLPESELASAKALNLLGEVAFYRKDDARAEEFFRAALASEPENIEAHFGLSRLLYERGSFKDAVLHAHYAQTHDKNNGHFAAHATLCFLAVGDLAQAYWSSQRAVSIEPTVARYWNDHAITYRLLGKLDEAESGFRKALGLDPNLIQAKENLASLLTEKAAVEAPENVHSETFLASPAHTSSQTTQNVGAAENVSSKKRIDELEEQFARNSDDPEIALDLASLLDQDGQTMEAISVLSISLTHQSSNMALRRLRGMFYSKMNHPRKACIDIWKVLKQTPDDPELLSELGHIYAKANRFSDAIAFFERCVEISEKIEYQVLLGNLYVSSCHYDKGLALYDKILRAHPDVARSIDFGYGTALFSLGEFDRAKPYIDRTLQVMPYNSEARFTRASLSIMHGDFEAGWEDYRYRVFTDQRISIRLLPMPLWEGEDLAGKRILLLAEQGLGDQIMFASILPDLLSLKPQQVIIEAHERIAKTLARSFPQCLVIPSRQNTQYEWLKSLPKIDYYLPIAELARFFRKRNADFPKHQGYLHADPQRIAFWKKQLDDFGEGLKVGISWRGGTERTRQAIRSLQITDLEPFLLMPGVRFVNLQYGKVKNDLKIAKDNLGIDILYRPEAITDLDEFAALICALDLVITVCNTTVHYAGALNRNVWVMTPKIPEWRYGLTGSTMIWYPSARMFRQAEHFDWARVISDVKQALEEKLSISRHIPCI